MARRPAALALVAPLRAPALAAARSAAVLLVARLRALVLERPVALDEASSHFVTALFNHFDVLIPDELFANRDWLEPVVAAAP